MGNKQSTPARSQSAKGVDQVRRRDKKGKGKRERPTSAPPTDGSVSVQPGFFPRPVAGKVSARSQENVRATAANDFVRLPSGSVSGSHDRGSEEAYRMAMDQVLGVWPEYHPIRDIDPRSMQPNSLTSLERVYNRLREQHSLISDLSREKHDLTQGLHDAQDEKRSMLSSLRTQDDEISYLQTDVALLKDELKKHKLDVKLPDRPRSSRVDSDMDRHTHRRDGSMGGGASSDDPRAQLTEKLRQKAEHGYVMATPIVQMEGKNMQAVLSRKTSMRSAAAGSEDSSVPVGGDPNKLIEELNEKVKRLQLALDREKKSAGGTGRDLDGNFSTSTRRKGLAMDTVVSKYKELSTDATDHVFTLVTNQLGHVNESRKTAFICAAMEISFNVCSTTIQSFHTKVQGLLLNPTKGDAVQGDGTDDTRTRGAVLRKVSKLEQPQGVSRLALRTWAAGEVPQALLDQINTFLEKMSDITSLTSVVEDVENTLSKDYSDCTTSTLLNQNNFSQFIKSCCRLAWQMNVINPPMDICVDPKRPFDERVHMQTSLADSEASHTQIDYFVWPTLLSKKHGDVLVKGLVSLKETGHHL